VVQNPRSQAVLFIALHPKSQFTRCPREIFSQSAPGKPLICHGSKLSRQILNKSGLDDRSAPRLRPYYQFPRLWDPGELFLLKTGHEVRSSHIDGPKDCGSQPCSLPAYKFSSYPPKRDSDKGRECIQGELTPTSYYTVSTCLSSLRAQCLARSSVEAWISSWSLVTDCVEKNGLYGRRRSWCKSRSVVH
jgi:hypothetical protein